MSDLSDVKGERDRISKPSTQHLEEYLNYQFPATIGNILLHEFCETLRVGDVKGFEADAKRLDKLSMLVVEVRQPLQWGSRHLFTCSPEEQEGGPDLPSDLRVAIDEAFPPTKESVAARVEPTKEAIARHAAEEIESCMNATGFPITDGDVETFKNVILNAIAAATAPPLEPHDN